MAIQQLLACYSSGGAAVTYATWSPAGADKDPSITLSGGNLIATGSSTVGLVRGTIAIGSKRYFECSYTPNANSIGIGVATAATATAQYVGQATTSYGHYLNGNDVYNNAAALYNGANNAVSPVTVGIAIDGTKMWVRFTGTGIWEGGGDPTTGASPTVTLGAGTYYQACTPGNSGGPGVVTLNSGASAFTLWTPTGGFSGVS